MTSSCRRRILSSVVVLATSVCATNVYAASRQKTWAEWLGLINYEPIKHFYKDYEKATRHYSKNPDHPLIPYLPKSSHDIHSLEGVYADMLIAEYSFGEDDESFFEDRFRGVEQSLVKSILAELSNCPWQKPISTNIVIFENTKPILFGARVLMVVDQEEKYVWHYFSIPKPVIPLCKK